MEDVRIMDEEDYKKIQINFDYQQKRKMTDLLTMFEVYSFPFFKNIWQSCKERISRKSTFSKNGTSKQEKEFKNQERTW